MQGKPQAGVRVRITGRTWHGHIGEVITDLPLGPGRAEHTARVRLLGRDEALTFELADLEAQPGPTGLPMAPARGDQVDGAEGGYR